LPGAGIARSPLRIPAQIKEGARNAGAQAPHDPVHDEFEVHRR
jgi:hypothetical protein